VAEKSIPKFPPQSEIVLDNPPYYCLQVDKPLSFYTFKADMIWRLHKKGVLCTWPEAKITCVS